VTRYEYELIPVNMKRQIKYKNREYYMYMDKGYIEDERVLEAVKPYLAKADQVLSQPVGEALVKLDGDRELVRSRETNLANLVTDSIRSPTGIFWRFSPSEIRL